MGKVENAYSPSEVGGWTGHPKTYKKDKSREYFVPNLRQAKDHLSRHLSKIVAKSFCLLLSTMDHSIQQERGDLDYVEYREETSSNAFIQAFKQVGKANGVANNLQIITIFNLFFLDKVLL